MSNFLRLLGRRLIALPFMAFGVIFLVFFLMSFSKYDPAVAALGENATGAQLEAFRHEMGSTRLGGRSSGPIWSVCAMATWACTASTRTPFPSV